MIKINSVNKQYVDIYNDYIMIRQCEGIEVVFNVGDIKDCKLGLKLTTIDEKEIMKEIEGTLLNICGGLISKG